MSREPNKLSQWKATQMRVHQYYLLRLKKIEPQDPMEFALFDFQLTWNPSLLPSSSFLSSRMGMRVLCLCRHFLRSSFLILASKAHS